MTTKRSATHAGHCQVCGELQLLPTGRLSTHGYTVALGFFSGTCFGSGELPFEQSIALVLDSIERATTRKLDIGCEIAQLRETPPGSCTAWAHLYVAAKRIGQHVVRSHHEWRQVQLRLEHSTIGGREFDDVVFESPVESEFGEKRRTRVIGRDYPVSGYPKTLAAVVAAMNAKRIEFLKSVGADIDRYIAAQRSRIDGWQPSDLMPRAQYPKAR